MANTDGIYSSFVADGVVHVDLLLGLLLELRLPRIVQLATAFVCCSEIQ